MLASACTTKRIILEVPSDITQRIAEANKSVCTYKGRVSVVYTTQAEDVRFKGYLDKDCKDNFRMKILGLFNAVAYDISYQDGEVQAYKKDADVSSEMAYFMRSRGLDSMISLVRYPHITVDKSFRASALGDEFILRKADITVAAGEDYLIRRVEFEGGRFFYEYEGGSLAGLVFEGEKMRLEIGLR